MGTCRPTGPAPAPAGQLFSCLQGAAAQHAHQALVWLKNAIPPLMASFLPFSTPPSPSAVRIGPQQTGAATMALPAAPRDRALGLLLLVLLAGNCGARCAAVNRRLGQARAVLPRYLNRLRAWGSSPGLNCWLAPAALPALTSALLSHLLPCRRLMITSEAVGAATGTTAAASAEAVAAAGQGEAALAHPAGGCRREHMPAQLLQLAAL